MLQKNIQVFENLIGDYCQDICNHLDDKNFAWYYFPNVQTHDYPPPSRFVCGFRHKLYGNDIPESPYHYIVTPVISEITKRMNQQVVSIVNAHANLGLNLGEPFEGLPHTDANRISGNDMELETEIDKRFTAIYYVDDSDGDTIFYDDDITEIFRVSPEKDKCVVFETNTFHSGSLPTKHSIRRVLNINLLMRRQDD
jgi:hypothetical protein